MKSTSSYSLIYVIIIVVMNLMVQKTLNTGRNGVVGLQQPDILVLTPQQPSQSWYQLLYIPNAIHIHEKPKYKELASSSSHPGSGDSLPPLQAY